MLLSPLGADDAILIGAASRATWQGARLPLKCTPLDAFQSTTLCEADLAAQRPSLVRSLWVFLGVGEERQRGTEGDEKGWLTEPDW